MKFIFLIMLTLMHLILQWIPVSKVSSSYTKEDQTNWTAKEKEEKQQLGKETKLYTDQNEK
ncbi:hypothetical protein [Myroides sp. DF42-4-2]|uniref:hypothetical protein n=1 Tax=unclassified Myroides TaxID=2642485 RepID=UPI002575D2A9|nr:hypothetical protein [Myroides sp. DF42-4-2]MDM1407531.1 hypothetical protein [Myroides sp. DF42-4-2]